MKIGEKKQVESFTTKGLTYDIFKTEDGYKCTCPAFTMGDGRKCKHIRRLQHLRYKKRTRKN